MAKGMVLEWGDDDSDEYKGKYKASTRSQHYYCATVRMVNILWCTVNPDLNGLQPFSDSEFDMRKLALVYAELERTRKMKNYMPGWARVSPSYLILFLCCLFVLIHVRYMNALFFEFHTQPPHSQVTIKALMNRFSNIQNYVSYTKRRLTDYFVDVRKEFVS